jgi:hypothetical protein
VKGAAFSAAVGAVATALSKVAEKIQGAGVSISQGSRKIYQPASIYGAKQEKAINDALDAMGIHGAPQSQYTQLLPTYQKLSQNIDDYLAAKPGVFFDTMELKKAMMEGIQNAGVIRSGVMTTQEAQKAVNAYVTDIMSTQSAVSSFGNRISGRDLFSLKMEVLNPDVSRAYEAIERGQPLTTTQNILKSIRDSVDRALTGKYPEIKDATMLQSYLYDAADSLNKSRKLVPTFRAFGTTIPAGTIAGAQDWGGRLVNWLGGQK